MHYLHKILVYIPDVSKEADSMIRDSLVSALTRKVKQKAFTKKCLTGEKPILLVAGRMRIRKMSC